MDHQEHPTSTRPAISPLRQRMIEDMTIRRFGAHTQRDYVRQVAEFTAFLGRAPDQADPEDLRRYQLHLARLGTSYARMNLACPALRFFTSRWAERTWAIAWPASRRPSA
ncbi:phage integrase N-terminal SAM-like domain-containing protein [Xanthobacter autotrophicus]|uniref:phage integrase N-terminal SAM-like domain-containing protein n=1 Tax=Xanthobacter autotrophicus TaxID=280 RepID=UPI0037298FA6